MPTLNLTQAQKLYYGSISVRLLYIGNQLVYPLNTDPYFDNVVLFVKGDGVDNSTNITDSSSNPKIITVNGNSKISATKSKYGNSSLFFDGSGDYLNLNNYSDSWNDFTIELWAYVVSNSLNSNGCFVSVGNSYLNIGSLNNQGRFRIQIGGTNFESTNFMPINEWFHYAVCRAGNNVKVFVNGVLNHSLTNDQPISISNNLLIGSYNPGSYFFNGYIDSLRITKGIARYGGNFNPETYTFL
jgi:hypothetical protein